MTVRAPAIPAPVVDIELSKKLMKKLRGKDTLCFNNALHVVWDFDWGTKRLRYVEGWAVTQHGLVCQHGWAEYCGKIIETTPVWLSGIQKPDAITQYFPGKKYTRLALGRAITKAGKKVTLPLAGWGYDTQGHRDAHKAAYVAMLGEEGFEKMFGPQYRKFQRKGKNG